MQSSGNDMGGLTINEYLDDQAADSVIKAIAARQQARTDAASLLIADMPCGDLFILAAGDKWDGPTQQLVTTSRDKAFAKFNELVGTTYEGDIVTVRSYRSIDDEFQHEAGVTRDGAYRFEATGSEEDFE